MVWTPKATFTGVVINGPDANGLVIISGTTYRRARVSLDLGDKGTNEETVRADRGGRFQFTVTVGFGSTPVRLSATAHGHRAAAGILTVNRSRPQVLTPPSTPSTTSNNSSGTSGSSQTGSQGGNLSTLSTTSNNSSGTSGSSQTGSQGGNLSTLEQILLDSSEYSNGIWAADNAMELDGGWDYTWSW
jgi:hypothetical protein